MAQGVPKYSFKLFKEGQERNSTRVAPAQLPLPCGSVGERWGVAKAVGHHLASCTQLAAVKAAQWQAPSGWFGPGTPASLAVAFVARLAHVVVSETAILNELGSREMARRRYSIHQIPSAKIAAERVVSRSRRFRLACKKSRRRSNLDKE